MEGRVQDIAWRRGPVESDDKTRGRAKDLHELVENYAPTRSVRRPSKDKTGKRGSMEEGARGGER